MLPKQSHYTYTNRTRHLQQGRVAQVQSAILVCHTAETNKIIYLCSQLTHKRG